MSSLSRIRFGDRIRLRFGRSRSVDKVDAALSRKVIPVVGEEHLEALSDFLDKEIATAWQRKSSFESRAFPLVTMNVGLTTLYLTLLKSFDLQIVITGFWPSTWILTTIAAAFSSILFAALAALPARYPGHSVSSFWGLYEEAMKEQDADHYQRIVESKLFAYESACISNQRKALFIFVSFVFMALFAASLIASLLIRSAA
ncbi:hypothetical protein [Nocardia brasiliensis]|uniref:hypothetical protein n=1 Tax=Nocardia brasiliensis TaxID=37326 RepID=UPI003D8CE679